MVSVLAATPPLTISARLTDRRRVTSKAGIRGNSRCVLCESAKERARLGTGDGCPRAHCWRNRDRRQGRQPRPLRHVPDGRGRGAATDVRRHPVTDRPAAGTAGTGMNSASVKCSKRYGGEVCLSVRAEQRVSALPHSQRRAKSPLARGERALLLPNRSKCDPGPQNRRKSGECRLSGQRHGFERRWKSDSLITC
jgi:hypothetical protein